MPSYFWVSKIDINILLEFVLPAEKVGGRVLKNTITFRFAKTIGNPGRPLSLLVNGTDCSFVIDTLVSTLIFKNKLEFQFFLQ